MALRLKNENEILDEKIRKGIIEEIIGEENQSRKDDFYRRYMCFKDQTHRYVIENLLKQFDQLTVEEMQYAIANLSFTKKVVKKLARSYNEGVKRTARGKDGAEKEDETKKIEENARLLNMNSVMKKTDRYLRLHHNITVQICPIPVDVGGALKYKLQVKPLQPYFYDVIENFYDREQPMVYITSSYKQRPPIKAVQDPATEGRSRTTPTVIQPGDGKDQKIADSPSDQNAEREEYVWWSNKYHFTTNGKGEILPDVNNPEGVNPFEELPFENFAIDQDGSFWALGGNDITQSGILVNSMISNINHIGITQGYGQFWMKGEKNPRTIKFGPNKAILMDYKKDEAEPDLGFASANPPLEDLKSLVEMYIALSLTTNNLSTSGVASHLTGGKDFASGIAIMIDKAESTEEVEDQQQIFHDKEPRIWRKYQKVQSVYAAKDLLVEEFKEHLITEDPIVGLKFGEPRPIQSENEKLDALNKRKNLGLNTQVELLMKDNPDLTKEQAQEKLKEILAERADLIAKGLLPDPVARSKDASEKNPPGKKDDKVEE